MICRSAGYRQDKLSLGASTASINPGATSTVADSDALSSWLRPKFLSVLSFIVRRHAFEHPVNTTASLPATCPSALAGHIPRPVKRR